MSLCAELDLLPPAPMPTAQTSPVHGSANIQSSPTCSRYRLQMAPQPLEANHIIDLPKQLLALSIGTFVDGSPLKVTHDNYSKPGFFIKLGRSIAEILEAVPRGGVLGKLLASKQYPRSVLSNRRT